MEDRSGDTAVEDDGKGEWDLTLLPKVQPGPWPYLDTFDDRILHGSLGPDGKEVDRAA